MVGAQLKICKEGTHFSTLASGAPITLSLEKYQLVPEEISQLTKMAKWVKKNRTMIFFYDRGPEKSGLTKIS